MRLASGRATELTALLLLTTTALSCASPAPRGKSSAQPISPDLEPFLHSYFATWSAGEMRAYKEHFHRDAVVTFVQDGDVKSSLPRDRFVMLQAASQARAKVQPIEHMTSFTADEDERAATVVAHWELTKGEGEEKEITRGVDRFTLIRDERGRWKIAALVFYVTE